MQQMLTDIYLIWPSYRKCTSFLMAGVETLHGYKIMILTTTFEGFNWKQGYGSRQCFLCATPRPSHGEGEFVLHFKNSYPCTAPFLLIQHQLERPANQLDTHCQEQPWVIEQTY